MTSRRGFVTGTVASMAAARLLAQPVRPVMIDSHVHVWKHDPAYPFAEGANVPAMDATPETLLGLMAANDVRRTVIIQVSHYRWDNRYLADVLRRFPGKFLGVCRVNPEDPGAPDTLSRLTEERGFHGVRLSPDATAKGDWIRGALMEPLWARCEQLKVPMTLLTPVTRMPDVVPLIERHPELTGVIDHMADCPLGEREKLALLLGLARYPKVYVKISHAWSLSKVAYPYPDALDQVKRLRDGFGAGRLMWGTDWPISLKELPYARVVELYRDHLDFLSAGEREDVLYKTVQRVWPFGVR